MFNFDIRDLYNSWSAFRREKLGWFTKKEMICAYVNGSYATSNNPKLSDDKDKLEMFAEFYITMDLFVDTNI